MLLSCSYIYLKCYGGLNKYCENNKKIKIEINSKFTIKSILINESIPISQVGLILINGKQVDLDYKLNENDQIIVMTLLSGG